jgi:hypothetical protein
MRGEVTDADFILRRDLGGVIHWEMAIPGRSPDTWTPLCQPNTDWMFLTNDRVQGGGPTCLWCACKKLIT